MSYSYCNNYKDIVNILESNLFGKNPYNVLQSRYEQMQSHFLQEYEDEEKCAIYDIISGQDKKGKLLNDALLKVPLSDFSGKVIDFKGYFNLGHDLPFWIEPDNPKGRIMLVSQDPLRSGQKDTDIITLSSPFGMHSKEYRYCGHHKTFTSIVENIVDQGYSVYLTDSHKLYGTENSSDYKSCISKLTTDIDMCILQEEINFFSPSIVFALGHQAEAALMDLHQSGVYIPHPTGARIKTGKGNKVNFYVNQILSAMS